MDRTERERLIACVPLHWRDWLLSGPDAAIPPLGEPITQQHIEYLMRAIVARMRAVPSAAPSGNEG
jgi:hypothetical protein